MIIDAHNHPDWCGYNLEKYLANMAKYNIDVTWLLSWECPADEYAPGNIIAMPDIGPNGPIPFARCISYAERAPAKFVLGYAPDPRRPEAIDHLQAMMDIYGVRVCGELKLRMMYDNPDALRLYRFCGKKRLPVTVHIDYEFDTGAIYPRPNYWYGGGIEAFERAIQACPETIFCGHAPGFWAHISGDGKHDKEAYPKGKVMPGGKLIAMLRQYENLYCDWSAGSGANALIRDPDFAKDFVLEFQDRLLYARDYFDNQHQEFMNGLDLPAAVLAKIYSGNALKLVPLPGI
ncbi:MAG: amidohydrolase [Verrucomicrobia bacterium]|nr:amidohydrolase [Verrucomicrobiota bacterium]MBU1733692.1 amidohydrolase [Verrucomicrobiota bacterium]